MREVGSNRVPPSPVRAVSGRAAELEAIDAFLREGQAGFAHRSWLPTKPSRSTQSLASDPPHSDRLRATNAARGAAS